MVFSFHASLRAIPSPLREVAAIYRLNTWQTFRYLEVPSSMIGLVWNSMMSMAGGWFFLTVTEAFTLRNQDYRLPGVGAYMNEAIHQGNATAACGAVVAMIVMIVFVDQFVWRPLVVWSQRFKIEETPQADEARSWLLDLLARSRVMHLARRVWRQRRLNALFRLRARATVAAAASLSSSRQTLVARVVGWIAATSGLVWLAWSGWQLVKLLFELPLQGNEQRGSWLVVIAALGASFLRTTAAVLLGAAWTVPAGIVIGRSPKLARRCQPVIQVLASFPAPMLFPLVTAVLVWSHVPFALGCVVLMMLGTQWYLLFNVIAGAQSIPADLDEVSRAFHLSTLDRWRRLYLPCVFPYLTTGLVTAAGGAWNATIVAEYVVTGTGVESAFGLGSLISQATASGDFSLLAAGVVTMAGSVVLINRVVWRRLYRLSEERFRLLS
jgi:NitT/TauT family transport system permease protein